MAAQAPSIGSRRVAAFIPEELGAPHEVLTRNGVEISYASPEGRRPNPGGHAPTEDLHQDPAMGRLLAAAVDAGTVIGAVCHGPAALLSATDPDRRWLFAGRRVTALDNEEEQLYGTREKAPFLLESRLVELGAQFEHGPPWISYVVADGPLITGQNPASAGAVANAILTTRGN